MAAMGKSWTDIATQYILNQLFGYQDVNEVAANTNNLKAGLENEHTFVDAGTGDHGKHADNFITQDMLKPDVVDGSKMDFDVVELSGSTTGTTGVIKDFTIALPGDKIYVGYKIETISVGVSGGAVADVSVVVTNDDNVSVSTGIYVPDKTGTFSFRGQSGYGYSYSVTFYFL